MTPDELIGAAARAIEGVLPRHEAELSLAHNEHKTSIATVEEYVAFFDVGDDDWISPEQREKAFATQEMWTATWYPSTPNGSCTLLACDFSALICGLAAKVEG